MWVHGYSLADLSHTSCKPYVFSVTEVRFLILAYFPKWHLYRTVVFIPPPVNLSNSVYWKRWSFPLCWYRLLPRCMWLGEPRCHLSDCAPGLCLTQCCLTDWDHAVPNFGSWLTRTFFPFCSAFPGEDVRCGLGNVSTPVSVLLLSLPLQGLQNQKDSARVAARESSAPLGSPGALWQREQETSTAGDKQRMSGGDGVLSTRWSQRGTARARPLRRISVVVWNGSLMQWDIDSGVFLTLGAFSML